MKAKKEIVGADENIISIFTSVFAAITNSCNDYIESKHIEQWLKHGNYKVSVTKFGLEMNKYAKIHKLENVFSKDKKVGVKTKKVWYGLKLYPAEVEEEFEEFDEML